MLLNHSRALAKMDAAGLDALVAAIPRNVYYASGFWNRNLEWGSQEAQAAVVVPRDPAIAPMLVVPEFAIAGLLARPSAADGYDRLTAGLDLLRSGDSLGAVAAFCVLVLVSASGISAS